MLQAIIFHRADGQPLSIEAGVVRVADALDMAKGRSRIPFESGRVSIHSLSAAAIEGVRIRGARGKVLIEIEMNNSAGLFQVDNLLKSKLRGSGLEQYLDVRATLEGNSEKRLLPSFASRRLRSGGRPPSTPLVSLGGSLRGRLMVGRLTLDQVVGVRVPAPQLRLTNPNPPNQRRVISVQGRIPGCGCAVVRNHAEYADTPPCGPEPNLCSPARLTTPIPDRFGCAGPAPGRP